MIGLLDVLDCWVSILGIFFSFGFFIYFFVSVVRYFVRNEISVKMNLLSTIKCFSTLEKY